jgi:DNA invertase Pin-like site-specific DNA recombinase
MTAIIAYYRVSTKRQGASGLGLEAQREAVRRYAEATHSTIKASYTEVESGKRGDRPELLKALAHAKRSKATLVVAKLDRLSRNVAFTSTLMESGVHFLCCDMPSATHLTIHILAAVAEDEARRISERTRDALAVAKSKGKPLGSARPGHWDGYRRCPECQEQPPEQRALCTVCGGTGRSGVLRHEARLHGLAKARTAAVQTLQEQAAEAYVDLLVTVPALRIAGRCLQEIVRLYPGHPPLLDFEVDGVVHPFIPYDPDQFGRETGPQGYVPGVPINFFDFAYALTCHRSQGDEFGSVLVGEPSPGRAWAHERWTYTAASRARKRLYWVADKPPVAGSGGRRRRVSA